MILDLESNEAADKWQLSRRKKQSYNTAVLWIVAIRIRNEF
jgi:hypothetical protein